MLMKNITSECLRRQKEIEALLLRPIDSAESVPGINKQFETIFDNRNALEPLGFAAYLAISQVHETRGVSYTWVPRVRHIARALEEYNPQLKSPLEIPSPYTLQNNRFPLIGVTVSKGGVVVSKDKDRLAVCSSDDFIIGFHTMPLEQRSTVVTIVTRQSDVVKYGELQVGISVAANPAYNILNGQQTRAV